MSFWSNFTHGFAHGAINSMFGGFFGMPYYNWGGCCCNPMPMFFTPSLFMGGFNRYTQPMMNMFQMPMMYSMPQWNSMPMSGLSFGGAVNSSFNDVGFDTYDFSSTKKTSLNFDSYINPPSSSSTSSEKDSSAKKSTSNTKTATSAKKTATAKSSGVKSSTSTVKKGNVKVQHWSKMSDEELKAVYGNYTRDITQPYKGSAADINKYLKGKGVLEGQGQAFIDAQNKYGISAAVLVGIAMFETGKGTSNIATTKNNVGGVRIRGSKEFRKFGSIGECLMEMARFLKVGYAENSGRPLTKLYQVNAKYCPASETSGNSRWAKNVDLYASELEKTARA